ncbi:Rieske (2Fe-2S) protein [Yinghuangia seranimata]|uniref:Rieske (2Fe-2S) protein n=1 Tax=Yinghuangia seranimata TaxID=408067 RepID=UPI00248C448F|nr:Rieske (2Fe-2S) protein [Yinghuangia seranimata]MDI2130224.1 Rieske (2Fe-2S) protein [Yinghuangia seranimata]
MDVENVGVGRRRLLAVSAAAVGGAALVACGSDSKDSGSGSATTAGSQPAGGGQTSAGGGQPSGASSAGGGKVLAKTSDIPVGGGKIFDSQKVVVTQPTAGTFKAFSSTCTHQGCTVAKVADGLIQCPCHGSEYSIVDASVKAGPAPKPLPPKQITVTGDQISLA